jgi:plasmid stability protein
MSQIIIRKLDEKVAAHLKRLAWHNGLSLEEAVCRVLTRAVDEGALDRPLPPTAGEDVHIACVA